MSWFPTAKLASSSNYHCQTYDTYGVWVKVVFGFEVLGIGHVASDVGTWRLIWVSRRCEDRLKKIISTDLRGNYVPKSIATYPNQLLCISLDTQQMTFSADSLYIFFWGGRSADFI